MVKDASYLMKNYRFVCAQAKAYNTPVRLRSYTTESSIDHLLAEGCKIWEAARATSAASGFFDPIPIGLQTYIDGATECNNPVNAVWSEAGSIWDDLQQRIQSLVSIGTGKRDLRDFGDDLPSISKSLISIATETETTEQLFYERHISLGLEGRYFRFNVDQGLAQVKLAGIEKLDHVQTATEQYLNDQRVNRAIDLLVMARPPFNGNVNGIHYRMFICLICARLC